VLYGQVGKAPSTKRIRMINRIVRIIHLSHKLGRLVAFSFSAGPELSRLAAKNPCGWSRPLYRLMASPDCVLLDASGNFLPNRWRTQF
jgi:hypothetical protein